MRDTDRYNRDWDHLCQTVVLTWPEPCWQGCRHLDDVLSVIATAPDETLTVLLRRAQRGDHLAGRVVVQALLGKLARMAGTDPTATVHDYVVHAWLALMRYPVERRRGSVAGGLVLDALKGVVAERPRREQALLPAPEGPQPDADLLLRRARRDGLVDPITYALLNAIYVEGHSTSEAARRVGMSEAAARQRCSRTLRRLASSREELAA